MQEHKINRISSFDLMERIKNSDQLALRILYGRLWERMYVLAFSMLHDEAVSKDIVQEIWIDLWERRNKILNQNIEAYIIKATRFKVFKVLRDTKMNIVPEEFLEGLSTSDADGTLEKIYVKETESKIHKAVEKLPKKCNQVFLLSRKEGLANAEISKMLNISQRTVETHISNAIVRIKRELTI
ncbi:sigma-70 family RNA polymerase sigma factor [Maribacter polysiphoniae]|uniref:RNA polymerase sigma-70 factor (ECF subfamily) n=1 Tax=Maribacter polysiphoniae TaxID=429344 RepID=A0A316E3Q9_9FLAO|nr:sigma-70 family RNA polymerase sigma factor [Maribacter polysiphoniae]MBD1260575.1 sigma-70 family RNA polymerase sigma factor [Maribacter polysiphoniae]PWK24298.1 RNA polymerase sigma-70 factor (ECF subfamily) [Maribacter polysiphoniae]